MFQFTGFAPRLVGVTGLQPAGFSHSEICGLHRICQSPQLIAAYHVLHRLWEPRHPPYALHYFLLYWEYSFARILNLGFSMTLSQHVKELLDQFWWAPTAICKYLRDEHIVRLKLLINATIYSQCKRKPFVFLLMFAFMIPTSLKLSADKQGFVG